MSTPTCHLCAGTDGLRVVRPRVRCTVSTFAAPEIRCAQRCKMTRGMWRLTSFKPEDMKP